MGKKIGKVIIAILAVLGVLFIILMLLPDDEEDDDVGAQQPVVISEEAEAEEPAYNTSEDTSGSEGQTLADLIMEHADEDSGAGFVQTEESTDTSSGDAGTETAGENTVTVNIPSSQLSGDKISFKTLTLDDKEVTQDVFSGYDLTIVHVWGTYCQPCISEMGDYAKLYKELPDNVNLIAIVCDVYDGIDRNVSAANSILSDAGAEFTNLRTSDDIYNLISDLQYIPSSFFVDREGHLIGEKLNGASYSETVAQLKRYLE